jgi:hypothetical protein
LNISCRLIFLLEDTLFQFYVWIHEKIRGQYYQEKGASLSLSQSLSSHPLFSVRIPLKVVALDLFCSKRRVNGIERHSKTKEEME